MLRNLCQLQKSYFCHYSVSYFFIRMFLRQQADFIFLRYFINSICLFFLRPLVSLSGDVEVNPGPNPKTNKALSICHWNFNSTSVHNCTKLHLSKSHVTLYKFDIICLSETYLDSSKAFDDTNLEISGYNLVRFDHSSNIKRGKVCIYYKIFFRRTQSKIRT